MVRIKSVSLIIVFVFACIAMSVVSGFCAVDRSTGSALSNDLLKVRYNLVNADIHESPVFELSDDFAAEDPSGSKSGSGYKSPAKAFILSLAVPGLGQYYYGSKIKPLVFLGVEVTSWVLYFKWNSEGDDITAEFEAFNRLHWSSESYGDYLYEIYGVRDDDSIPAGVSAVTHHLPDTYTQQYYEMTGKYDQFAWGWDDAVFGGSNLETLIANGTLQEIITGETVPYSANRVFYETRRNDANSAYDRATRMVYMALANRLVSAFEALFATKSRNAAIKEDDETFGRLDVKPSLKSLNSLKDTPYLTLTYRF
ncbi:MAG: hypothetical protein AB1483_12905 [Candidatus Zixiibacteriota bacterium]